METTFLPPRYGQKHVVNPNPKLSLFFGLKKLGKSFAATQLGTHLINKNYTEEDWFDDVMLIDFENSYSKYMDFAPSVYDVSSTEKYTEFKRYINKRKKEGKRWKFAVIDTITTFEHIISKSIIDNTNKYLVDNKLTNKYGKASIDTLGEVGTVKADENGWVMLQSQLFGLVEFLEPIVDHIIIYGHNRQENADSSSSILVDVRDIDITGKKKALLAAKCDAIGFMHRGDAAEMDENSVYISFESLNNTGVTRCPHISGKRIKLSEKVGEGAYDINVFWENIFIDQSEWSKYTFRKIGKITQ
jgi:hypothetical protein